MSRSCSCLPCFSTVRILCSSAGREGQDAFRVYAAITPVALVSSTATGFAALARARAAANAEDASMAFRDLETAGRFVKSAGSPRVVVCGRPGDVGATRTTLRGGGSRLKSPYGSPNLLDSQKGGRYALSAGAGTTGSFTRARAW